LRTLFPYQDKARADQLARSALAEAFQVIPAERRVIVAVNKLYDCIGITCDCIEAKQIWHLGSAVQQYRKRPPGLRRCHAGCKKPFSERAGSTFPCRRREASASGQAGHTRRVGPSGPNINTTSSGSSQNWPMNARLCDPAGMTAGRSPLSRGKNWLVMNGIMQGMQMRVSSIAAASDSIRNGPVISGMISRPEHPTSASSGSRRPGRPKARSPRTYRHPWAVR
jgi:hypothetical protein